MDKIGFLKELTKHLAVLNETEQKDILDEYIQHIDMKMEKGMSEAEAIKDFGDIGELAADILEAYHVNPQYRSKKPLKPKDEIPVLDLKKTWLQVWKRMSGAVKALVLCAWSGMKKAVRWAAWPFVKLRSAWKQKRDTVSMQPHLPKNTAGKGLIRKVGYGMNRFLRATLYGIVTGIRWLWNLCVFFIALLTGGCTLLSLFGFGVLVVLLSQGYPLFGLTIASLGTVMCGVGITILLFSSIRKKEREFIPEIAEKTSVEEVLEHA